MLAVLGLVLIASGFASTALAGGGGGGECFPRPPELGQGWVAIGDLCFSPQTLEVGTGDVVRWENMGNVAHTVTFEEGTDSGQLLNGGTFAVQFNNPGSYSYFCSLHPGMTGTLRASGAALGSGPDVQVAGTDALSAPAAGFNTSVVDDAVPYRIEVSPLLAALIASICLPLSFAGTLRLVGVARRPSRLRLRTPWEVERPKAGSRR
jgi:hypothetical protein